MRRLYEVMEMLSGTMLGCVILIAIFFLVALFFRGAAWVSTKLLPWFASLSVITLVLVIFVALPLAIPKETREIASVGLHIASHIWGITLWMEGLLYTLSAWGPTAVFIGLFVLGIGVVPMGMLANIIKGKWLHFGELLFLAILTIGSRAIATYLSETVRGEEVL
jgi:hypothetical protein